MGGARPGWADSTAFFPKLVSGSCMKFAGTSSGDSNTRMAGPDVEDFGVSIANRVMNCSAIFLGSTVVYRCEGGGGRSSLCWPRGQRSATEVKWRRQRSKERAKTTGGGDVLPTMMGGACFTRYCSLPVLPHPVNISMLLCSAAH
jgi:hypothetical protein